MKSTQKTTMTAMQMAFMKVGIKVKKARKPCWPRLKSHKGVCQVDCTEQAVNNIHFIQ